MRTILIPPILKWNMLHQLPQTIAQQFARNGYKVIFCEYPDSAGSIREVENNLFVYSNLQQVLGDIRTGKIKIDIVYNTWAKNVDLIKYLSPKCSFYTICDMFSEWQKYENDMISSANIVTCVSQYIYDKRKEQHNNIHLLRNGCNISYVLNNNTIFPEDLKYIKLPLFGFVGAIGSWISTYLMRNIAKHYSSILIGCEFGKKCPDNVIDLGVKNHEELINYYNNIDVGLLPFNTKSEITIASSPIKLFEYLAAGKPVLATSWTETTLPEYEGVVFAAKTDDEFMEYAHYLANLTQEEKDNINIKAKSVAKNNTWEKRFEQIDILIKEFFN